MKVVISYGKLNFVGVSREQEIDIKQRAGDQAIIKDVVNGLSVVDTMQGLYKLLCDVSAKYDIDLV